MVQKKNTLTRTGIVALLACVCCILWGSAIPVIKTGYRLMEVDAADTASQIVFAGVRFTLAGLLVLIFASIREKKVLIMRYGLDDGKERTLEEVGKEFHVTRERIRQIEAKALWKIKHPNKSRKLRDFLEN